jgi:quinone-modifying oxidoreductase subunit QmoC
MGLAPKNQPTLQFGDIFWKSIVDNGRVNELKIGVGLYFKDGFGQGIKNALAGKELGMAMMKAKRMNAMEYFGGHKCKDRSGIAKMLKKAEEFEADHIAKYGK